MSIFQQKGTRHSKKQGNMANTHWGKAINRNGLWKAHTMNLLDTELKLGIKIMLKEFLTVSKELKRIISKMSQSHIICKNKLNIDNRLKFKN